MGEKVTEKTDIPALIQKIKYSRKYRGMGIPYSTIEDVLRRELERHPKPADAQRSAKAILHNIMAPYLGDVDYAQAELLLDNAFASNDVKTIKDTCRTILSQHDSTRERLPYLENFYRQILEICPHPSSILDLACGLNPFSFPYMGLPTTVRYNAYDIHKPRVALINRFFKGMELAPLAEVRDILVCPPENQTDAAFLFKEAHRMEKRRKGASRELVAALNAQVIFISLPNRSLDGRRDLRARMDVLFSSITEGVTGLTGSVEFPGETLYWIERRNG